MAVKEHVGMEPGVPPQQKGRKRSVGGELHRGFHPALVGRDHRAQGQEPCAPDVPREEARWIIGWCTESEVPVTSILRIMRLKYNQSAPFDVTGTSAKMHQEVFVEFDGVDAHAVEATARRPVGRDLRSAELPSATDDGMRAGRERLGEGERPSCPPAVVIGMGGADAPAAIGRP